MMMAEFEKMGVEHLAMGRTRKLGAGDEEEGEGVCSWMQASTKKLGIERDALRIRAQRRMGLDELVVEGKSWVGHSVEQLLCIVYVGDF